MSGKSDFTDEQWITITEAPLQVITTMYAAGSHGPISTIKESAAGAKALTQPGNRGDASGLIADIIPDAQSKEARQQLGRPHGDSIQQIIDDGVAKLQSTADVLHTLPEQEAIGVAQWLLDIGVAVAQASKGVTEIERTTLTKIASTLGVPEPSL